MGNERKDETGEKNRCSTEVIEVFNLLSEYIEIVVFYISSISLQNKNNSYNSLDQNPNQLDF